MEIARENLGMNKTVDLGVKKLKPNRVLERPNNQQNVAITCYNHKNRCFQPPLRLIQKPEALNVFFQESGLPWVVLTYSNQSIDGRLLYLHLGGISIWTLWKTRANK